MLSFPILEMNKRSPYTFTNNFIIKFEEFFLESFIEDVIKILNFFPI